MPRLARELTEPPNMQTDNLPFALGVHRHGDYHRDRPDLAAFTLF
jgi:hypothetical protein